MLCYPLGMPASTVKLEATLLRDIRAAKPPGQTLAAFVRDAVERELRRRKLRAAAEQYRAFLDEHPEELEDLERWEVAPLASAPKRTRS
jgi:hypothetical protein